MWKILIFLILGIAIGQKVNLSEKSKAYNGRIQYLGVMVLLFTMGATIGLNKFLLNNIKNIALKSFIFAMLTSMVTVVIVYLGSRLMIKDEEKHKKYLGF